MANANPPFGCTDSIFHVKGSGWVGRRRVTGPNARLTIGDNTYITASSVVYCAKRLRLEAIAPLPEYHHYGYGFHHIYYPDGTQMN